MIILESGLLFWTILYNWLHRDLRPNSTRRTSWKTSWKTGVATSSCVHGKSWKLVRATVMTKKPDLIHLIHDPTLFSLCQDGWRRRNYNNSM